MNPSLSTFSCSLSNLEWVSFYSSYLLAREAASKFKMVYCNALLD
jgi:hypothetical protein